MGVQTPVMAMEETSAQEIIQETPIETSTEEELLDYIKRVC